MDSPSRCAALERRIIEHELRIVSLEKTLADIGAKISWLNSQCELTHFEPFPSSPSKHAVNNTFSRCYLLLPLTLLRPQSSILSACTSRSQLMCSNLHIQPPLISLKQKQACLLIGRFCSTSIASKRAASDMQPTQRKIVLNVVAISINSQCHLIKFGVPRVTRGCVLRVTCDGM
jgi:hypothetical protein